MKGRALLGLISMASITTAARGFAVDNFVQGSRMAEAGMRLIRVEADFVTCTQ